MVRNRTGSLRIIAGSHRGRRIAAPAGHSTRPPLDQQRETIFNILGPVVSGAVVADLFAGSGSFGLEALSRGAREAVFVEHDPAALEALNANISDLGFEAAARVMRADAFRFPSAARRRPSPITVAFIDPPFENASAPTGHVKLAGLLENLRPVLASEAVIVVRLPLRAPAPKAPAECGESQARRLGKSRVHFLHFRKETERT